MPRAHARVPCQLGEIFRLIRLLTIANGPFIMKVLVITSLAACVNFPSSMWILSRFSLLLSFNLLSFLVWRQKLAIKYSWVSGKRDPITKKLNCLIDQTRHEHFPESFSGQMKNVFWGRSGVISCVFAHSPIFDHIIKKKSHNFSRNQRL